MIKHFFKSNFKVQQFVDLEQSKFDFNKLISYVLNIYHINFYINVSQKSTKVLLIYFKKNFHVYFKKMIIECYFFFRFIKNSFFRDVSNFFRSNIVILKPGKMFSLCQQHISYIEELLLSNLSLDVRYFLPLNV